MICYTMIGEFSGHASQSGNLKKTILSCFVVFGCMASASAGFVQDGVLITAFTNPAPAAFASFGYSVASVGGDRVFIGAPGDDTGAENAGAAYLFSTNGALLVTLTNPVPTSGASFGERVVTVGNDLVVVGARFADNGGKAYLFNTNGALLITLTNPNPTSAMGFGSSVAGIGKDRLLVGTDGYNDVVTNRGTAYLFSTNGALLTTLSDPTPGMHAFGRAIAVAFDDTLVIGAPHTDPTTVNPGSAYLFSTNGTLLTTFTNPSPASFDNFGFSAAAVGPDRVLIAALFNGAAGLPSGVAYLYNSNGAVLSSFTSPVPVANGQFAFSMAAVENDRLLFGAPYDEEWTRAGGAYLFSTNANPLVTFTNPSALEFPNQYLAFGYSIAAVGSDAVIIGSPQDETGEMDAGAAYLFSIPPALLHIRLAATNTVAVSWLSPAPGFMLQENTNAIATADWSNVTGNIQDDGTNLTHVVYPAGGDRFYRLFKP